VREKRIGCPCLVMFPTDDYDEEGGRVGRQWFLEGVVQMMIASEDELCLVWECDYLKWKKRHAGRRRSDCY